MKTYEMPLSRRALLLGGASAIAGTILRPARLRAAAETAGRRLVAAPGEVAMAGPKYPATAAWCYDGGVPGPELRLRQGERLRVAVENRLSEDTTVHWHGVRVPNAMDGVPDLTQPSIQPGQSFVYEFVLPDAGTYWYHSHAHSAEQIGRGLAGPLIVEEAAAPAVDRDVVWMLGDFRLRRDASIAGGFDNPMEMSMAGRIGNTVTLNGRVPERSPVRAGERLRLRLINAAAARIFGLEFREHRPIVVALDGQPVEPHEPENGRVVLGPAMRADLVIDMTGRPGAVAPVIDSFYENLSYKLVDLAYDDAPPLRTETPGAPEPLPANTMPEPDLAHAQRHQVTLTGGMMGSMGGGGMMGGGMGGMMSGGPMWAINGMAADGRSMKPMLTLARGRTCVFDIRNETAWHHPIHLHGYSFRVIARNGRPTRFREWRDTVLIAPHERAEIAFVADNPGDWMLHCHIVAHQDGGMMSVIRVA